jgi:hypothetical protein
MAPHFEFFHSPKFRLGLASDGTWFIRGSAVSGGAAVEVAAEFLPFFVEDYEKHRHDCLRYTYEGNTDFGNARVLAATNFLQFVTNPARTEVRFMGYTAFSAPSEADTQRWIRENIAETDANIALDQYAGLLNTKNFDYYVPKSGAPLEQHALAMAHASQAGKLWLYARNHPFGPWAGCTPQAQLMVRLLALMERASQSPPDPAAVRVLATVRRFMKVPASRYAHADILRVVSVHFANGRVETNLLNLYLAHSAATAALPSPGTGAGAAP